MENRFELLGVGAGAVNDEVGIDREKLEGHVRQILAPVSAAGIPLQKNDLFANDSFNLVRYFIAAHFFHVPLIQTGL